MQEQDNMLTLRNPQKFGIIDFTYVNLSSIYFLRYGTLCIRENPGCLFLATNRDAVTHLTDAQEWAG
jgi:phosphoglycolate phosphatase